MTIRTRPTGLVVLALTLVGCGHKSALPPGSCTKDADCTSADQPHCVSGTCVQCGSDAQCNCHQVCQKNACVPLGASDPQHSLDAHGNWQGTPGQASYGYSSACQRDGDCPLGDMCNPLTAGCVAVADFQTSCSLTQPCTGNGPNGEVLACDPTTHLCLPAAACHSNANCCGVATFLCDTGAGVCRAQAHDCTPPATVSSTCPLLPQVGTDVCGAGKFCSLLGECVGCTCDADCGAGLKCYQPTHECKAADYCRSSDECGAGKTCDVKSNSCVPTCSADNAATVCDLTSEYCDSTDHVCRPLADQPCIADSFEPNDTLAAAAPLTPPALGHSTTLSALSLCTQSPDTNPTPDSDWYSLALQAGDVLSITGSSDTGVVADMQAIAPDALTSVGTGTFGTLTPRTLMVTAHISGTYYVNVKQRSADSEGPYQLDLTLATAAACSDPFETATGTNDTLASATVLYDWDSSTGATTPPASCTSTTSGGTDTVACSGGVLKLCPGDVDYYLVHVAAGSGLQARLSQFAGNLDLYLYGPFASRATATTDRLADSSAQIQLTESVSAVARQDAYYALRVVQTAGDATPYDLSVAVTTPSTPCIEDSFDAPSAAAGSTTPTTQLSDPPGLNDTQDTASVIGLLGGQTISVTSTGGKSLSLCRADVDWFALEVYDSTSDSFTPVPAGRRITATVVPDAGTPANAITLQAGSGAGAMPYGSADPTAPVDTVEIERTTGSDTYYVAVYGNPALTVPVGYTLQLELLEPPACSTDSLGDVTAGGNDAPASAYGLSNPPWPAAVGDSYEYVADPSAGEVLSLCATDDDWYAIDVPAGAQLIAWVWGDPTQADMGLYAFDDSVASVSTPTAGVAPTTGLLSGSTLADVPYQSVRATPPGGTGGTVYLMVTNTSDWPLLDYHLGAQLIAAGCHEDPYDTSPGNSVWSSAARIPLRAVSWDRQQQVGIMNPLAMCSATSSDWYQVDLAHGDSIAVDVSYDPHEGNIDGYLYAPGPAGLTLPLAQDLDNAPSTGVLQLGAQIAAADPQGSYLVEIRPNGLPENTYALEAVVHRACVDDSSEPPPPEQVTTLGAPSSWPVDLPQRVLCNDRDWYDLTVPANATPVTACASFIHVQGDIDLSAYDASQITDTGAGDPSVSGNPIATSWTKRNVERVVLPGVAAATDYVLEVMLDPRDQVDTTYNLWFAQGDVSCCPGDVNDPCSGHGSCTIDTTNVGTCACDPGFTQPACDACSPGYWGPTCIPCPGGGNCSGHGTCDDGINGTGTCSCNPGFSGTDCATSG